MPVCYLFVVETIGKPVVASGYGQRIFDARITTDLKWIKDIGFKPG
jgi:hypothetical protein